MEDLVLLHGSPAQRGEQLGLSQKALLKKRVTEFRSLCEKHQLGPTDLPDRARQITTMLNVLGPEWLAEARAMAAAAQVPATSLMAITYPPEKVHPALLPKRANDSTAFGVCVDLAGTRALLMKNCDGPDIIHHVISRASSPGTFAYVALCEAADIGIKAFVNESGLAGTFHMGPPVDDYTLTSIQPSLVLRHLCERAASCAQALAEFDALQKRVGPGTPDKRGVCYLFADGFGEVVLLEATATRYQSHRVSADSIVATNKFQLTDPTQSRLEPYRERSLRVHLAAEEVTLTRALWGSRLDQRSGGEKGVCDADTRASFLAGLGANGKPSFALVTFGSPLYNVAFPLFPHLGAPPEMVNGAAYEAAMKSLDPAGDQAENRTLYEEALVQKLDTLTPSSTPEQMTGIIKEMGVLTLVYAASASPSETSQPKA